MIQFQSRQVWVFAILILIFLSQEQAFLNLLAYVNFSENFYPCPIWISYSEDVSDEINGKQVAV